MKKIRINNPCPEKWEDMQDSSEGKFCDKCSKKVWDLTDKTDSQIEKIMVSNVNICGRIISDCR